MGSWLYWFISVGFDPIYPCNSNSLLHGFMAVVKSKPFCVNLYFCERLLGLLGIVRSTNPLLMAGFRNIVRKCFRSLMPIFCFKPSRVTSPETTKTTSLTWGVSFWIFFFSTDC